MNDAKQIPASLNAIAKEHIKIAEKAFAGSSCAKLAEIVAVIVETFKKNGKVLLCGNGGSAADSQHIAAEFIVRFKRERRSLPAIALTTDTSVLTATANDYDYESVFSRQVEGLAKRGDCLIAISTSGNSPNIIKAVKAAKSKGVTTVGLTGEKGGKLAQQADVVYCVPSTKTPHIQEMHITALHAVSEVVEDQLFS
ncbi:MAG: phosphoheptose isomerase [Candidatus Omnitrophica bacterium CG11_big_fil_rev_8_21_14_0_20_45_26]|uniref:Phosphoheptose isomerase n=1 Tax=Candidatus Abzuiibacterium crystallinum TaxID=1974748 RepID=A0A2H0LS97_9BACT|nr:MAG: phosphoheptose isomerase [Candidatus Omnitrophica bacterium CG11_big_fil_rev_8_21_14_0_20_45_26]PIW64976.1 MAG: phosphoheptose isomerase [Candidatus Omnitrophica bacterium CG12_big_fil_rev_8_21_14_0_65_45_16]